MGRWDKFDKKVRDEHFDFTGDVDVSKLSEKDKQAYYKLVEIKEYCSKTLRSKEGTISYNDVRAIAVLLYSKYKELDSPHAIALTVGKIACDHKFNGPTLELVTQMAMQMADERFGSHFKPF
jgi:hypothetical protein